MLNCFTVDETLNCFRAKLPAAWKTAEAGWLRVASGSPRRPVRRDCLCGGSDDCLGDQ